MIQRKKKRIVLLIIIIAVIAMIGTGVAYFLINQNNKDNQDTEIVNEDIDFSSKRLVVTTNDNEELTEIYNAKSVNKTYSGSYILKYETEDETRKAYEKLKNNSQVLEVIVDIDVEIKQINSMLISYEYGSQNIEAWGLYTMGLDETQEKLNEKTTADEIVVAVIDTGFDLDLEMDETLENRIDSRYINITDNSTDISDNHTITATTGEEILMGHGTHTGGIVLDTTPNNVKMLPIKVEDDEGIMGLEYLKNAMQYAIDQDVDVINLSLGWQYNSSSMNTVQLTEEIGNLIQEAIEKDIIVVAAAGNGDEEGIRINAKDIYPVSYDGVIGVAALETNIIQITTGSILDGDSYNLAQQSAVANLTYTSFSNYGNMIDFSAPGQYILCLAPATSIYSTGEALPLFSGTSHAAPHIAAAAATVKSYNSEWGTDEISEILQYYADDLGTTGRDDDYGYGYVNFNDFVECECASTECEEIYCFGCTETACIYHVGQAKVLESIAVTTDPTNKVYTEGEVFNTAGMIVTATYSNGSTAAVTGYTYTPTGALSTTNTTITISYKEGEITAETTLVITVNAKQTTEPQEKTLESIAVTTDPTKKVYTEGDVFSPTGMVVTATYSDETTSPVTGYTYTPTGALSTTNTTITISYKEGEITKTTKLAITVNAKQTTEPQEKTLESIEITTPPTKTTYNEGEVFNPTGMVVTAIYSDGSKKVVEDYNCFPITPFTENNDSVTVQYNENGKTVTAKVAIVVNSSSNNSGNSSGSTNNGSTNNGSSTTDTKPTIIQENEGTDNTVKNQSIAYTGAEDYIIPIIIIAIIGIFTFIKYRQYKDI